MEPRHIEKAAEFCKLVGSPNLVEYLGLDAASADSAEVRAKLKDRRKYMQGMQSNPKYKAEAVFLIKNFRSLDKLLTDLDGYLAAVRREVESENLPIVEMTIRTVLKGGQMGADQKDYLLKQAADLGVADDTFNEILRKLAADAGVPLPGEVPLDKEGEHMRPNEGDSDHGSRVDPTNIEDDYYVLLGIHSNATRDDVYNAYRRRHEEARAMPDKGAATRLLIRLDRAWKVLGDPEKRRIYDLGRKRTGPPARDREMARHNQSETAPPARERGDIATTDLTTQTSDDVAEVPTTLTKGNPQLEVVGSTNRTIELTNLEPIEESILIRNVGDGQMSGRVVTDVPWLVPSPRAIDAKRREQVIVIRIEPGGIPTAEGAGTVSIQTDHGERSTVQFNVVKPFSFTPVIALVGGVAAIGVVIILAALAFFFAPGGQVSVEIQVDPTAERVVLNGAEVGSGSMVTVSEIAAGEATLEIEQTNFKPYTSKLDLTDGNNVVNVRLEPARAFDYAPAEDARQASLDPDFVQRSMTPRKAAMDGCVAEADIGGQPGDEGVVRIYVGPDGVPMGVQIEGAESGNAALADCFTRQAAAALFHPFKDGDYAVVRYGYTLKPEANTP